MKLKFLFFFLALLLTAVWTILLVLTLKERGALFYIGEMCIRDRHRRVEIALRIALGSTRW